MFLASEPFPSSICHWKPGHTLILIVLLMWFCVEEDYDVCVCNACMHAHVCVFSFKNRFNKKQIYSYLIFQLYLLKLQILA